MTSSPSAMERTLRLLAPMLAGLADDWWIIAGAALALHGVDDGGVGDVDLLVSRDDARYLASRLGIDLAPGPPSDRFRSELFGRWLGAPLPVEIMAGFHVRSGDGWAEVRPATRERVELGGATFFVPARDELRHMLLAFGRPRDRERVMLLTSGDGPD